MKRIFLYCIFLLQLLCAMASQTLFQPAFAEGSKDYVLGAGDGVRITVFQNSDLTTDARVSESGSITFPLIGSVKIGGLSIQAAENLIASRLKEGNFVLQPQVNLLLLQVRGNQVAVLGYVTRPGRYPLETFDTRLSDMLALAGGVAPTGGDLIVLQGVRDGKPVRYEIDIQKMFAEGGAKYDMVLSNQDIIYVQRAPMFYIYGEVQHPGSFRLERGMTVMQALATGGGVTQRGTVKGLKVRRQVNGKTQELEPHMDDVLQPDDVIFVKESLF